MSHIGIFYWATNKIVSCRITWK